MIAANEVKGRFRERFGANPRVFRAPGRVNLIGEHTDYNDGFVMPAAIDLASWVAIAPRNDRRVYVFSENLSEGAEFDLDDPVPKTGRSWSDYPRGVAVLLQSSGYRLLGADLLIRSDVPIGAGLSSSAAIEVSVGIALTANSGLQIEPVELARICQRAENEFVGMRCGIMDQFIACCGHAHQALMLDCRSLAYRLLPLPADVRLVLCNTMVKHELASGEYNRRRADCEEGVRHLQQALPDIRALRDVNLQDLEQAGMGLHPRIERRCRHVVTENQRVTEAASSLERNDLESFGRLMGESHRSLRYDYEVSCAELDLMVELAAVLEGVYGARMTGGGFGGCTINLVRDDCVEDFARRMCDGYLEATGRKPDILVCRASEGVSEINVA